MRKRINLNDNKIKKAKEILHPYKLFIDKKSLLTKDRLKLSIYFYRITIYFNKNFKFIDYFTLEQLVNISEHLKNEFELLNTEKYLLMRSLFYGKSKKIVTLDTANLINLHIPINSFDVENYNFCMKSKLNLNIIETINELCLYFQYGFCDGELKEGDKVYDYIRFILNDSKSEVFSRTSHINRIKLLVYYSEIFNFKDKIIDIIEEKVMSSW